MLLKKIDPEKDTFELDLKRMRSDARLVPGGKDNVLIQIEGYHYDSPINGNGSNELLVDFNAYSLVDFGSKGRMAFFTKSETLPADLLFPYIRYLG